MNGGKGLPLLCLLFHSTLDRTTSNIAITQLYNSNRTVRFWIILILPKFSPHNDCQRKVLCIISSNASSSSTDRNPFLGSYSLWRLVIPMLCFLVYLDSASYCRCHWFFRYGFNVLQVFIQLRSFLEFVFYFPFVCILFIPDFWGYDMFVGLKGSLLYGICAVREPVFLSLPFWFLLLLIPVCRFMFWIHPLR